MSSIPVARFFSYHSGQKPVNITFGSICIVLSTFYDISSPDNGGAVSCYSGTVFLGISDTSFANCYVGKSYLGGAIYSMSQFSNISRSCSQNCSSFTGAFFYQHERNTIHVNVIDASITRTSEDLYLSNGAVIYVFGGNQHLMRVNSTDNKVLAYGGGLYCRNYKKAEVEYVNIARIVGVSTIEFFMLSPAFGSMQYGNMINNTNENGELRINNQISVSNFIFTNYGGRLIDKLQATGSLTLTDCVFDVPPIQDSRIALINHSLGTPPTVNINRIAPPFCILSRPSQEFSLPTKLEHPRMFLAFLMALNQ